MQTKTILQPDAVAGAASPPAREQTAAHAGTSSTASADAGMGLFNPGMQRGAAFAAIEQLLRNHPLPESNASHIHGYERDYGILLHERGWTGAEATMRNIFAFETWRRDEERER